VAFGRPWSSLTTASILFIIMRPTEFIKSQLWTFLLMTILTNSSVSIIIYFSFLWLYEAIWTRPWTWIPSGYSVPLRKYMQRVPLCLTFGCQSCPSTNSYTYSKANTVTLWNTYPRKYFFLGRSSTHTGWKVFTHSVGLHAPLDN
jgi:hypothetical protein